MTDDEVEVKSFNFFSTKQDVVIACFSKIYIFLRYKIYCYFVAPFFTAVSILMEFMQ